MDNRKKIVAAVTAGVKAYIESQEKESALSVLERKSAFTINLWGVDGRQEIMQGKRMWQMRWSRR